MTSKLSSHVFQWDGITDPRALKPVEYCLCGLPRKHERHPEHWPETPAEFAAVEQRRLGENDKETTE